MRTAYRDRTYKSMDKKFRYWDFDETQRALMTREQIEAFTAVQLMEKGIIKPDPLPPMEDCPKPPELETELWYECAGNLFRTHEQAVAFLGLDPHKKSYYWQYSGSDCSYAESQSDTAVKPMTLFKHDSIISNKDLISKVRAFKDERSKREEEYNKAFKASKEAVADIWADWFECQEKERERQKVRTTFAEYCRMANGDKKIAFGFLVKAYGERLSRESLPDADLIEATAAECMPEEAAEAVANV